MKGPADFVTNADKRTEKILIDELTRVRPGYGFLAEESGAIEGKDKTHRFIIDPIDGTTNFLHGIPQFSISIALEREGQIVSALVHNPATDEMFVAEKGHGTYLNNKRLRVGARKTLNTRTRRHRHSVPGPRRCRALRCGTATPSCRTSPGIRRFGAASLDLGLCRGRPLRRVLGERDLCAVGHGRGIASGEGSAGHGERSLQWHEHARQRHHPRRQRHAASTIAEAYQGREGVNPPALVRDAPQAHGPRSHWGEIHAPVFGPCGHDRHCSRFKVAAEASTYVKNTEINILVTGAEGHGAELGSGYNILGEQHPIGCEKDQGCLCDDPIHGECQRRPRIVENMHVLVDGQPVNPPCPNQNPRPHQRRRCRKRPCKHRGIKGQTYV